MVYETPLRNRKMRQISQISNSRSPKTKYQLNSVHCSRPRRQKEKVASHPNCLSQNSIYTLCIWKYILKNHLIGSIHKKDLL